MVVCRPNAGMPVYQVVKDQGLMVGRVANEARDERGQEAMPPTEPAVDALKVESGWVEEARSVRVHRLLAVKNTYVVNELQWFAFVFADAGVCVALYIHLRDTTQRQRLVEHLSLRKFVADIPCASLCPLQHT